MNQRCGRCGEEFELGDSVHERTVVAGFEENGALITEPGGPVHPFPCPLQTKQLREIADRARR